MHRIIKAIIEFNDIPSKYRISVAIYIPNKKWKAFYKIVSDISKEAIDDVINTGEVLVTFQAKKIFPLIDNDLIYTITK